MLSENILSLRKKKGISQEDLAAELHVVRQTVSKWEKGLSVPDAQMLIRIAAALDTTVNTLLGESIPESEPQPSVQDIASQLEEVNMRLAHQAERRRKRLRIFFLILEILALCCVIQGLGSFLHFRQANSALSGSASVIGGIDQPVTIYVSHISVRSMYFLAHALVAILGAVGLFKTRRN